MATDRIRDCYIYTNYCSPEVKSSPLHLAAHNGRSAKFRELLAAANSSIHARTVDRHNSSLLSVALARGHGDIAAICLDYLEADLAILERHFAAIGGSIHASHFWLHQQTLVVTSAADVQHARAEAASLLMDPRDAADSGRKGLLMLLKPEGDGTGAEVLWLTARHSGDDRRLASLVARCHHRDGLLHLRQQDVWERTDFQVAARRNLHELWMRMFAAYGKHLLGRRDLATSFRLLAEHRPAGERIEYFRQLCRTVGGFESAELFEADAVQTFHVLKDALAQFNGDLSLFEHLVEVCAAGIQRRQHCPLEEAIAAVIDLQHPTAKGRHRHSLLDEAFKEPADNLQWLCLRFGPSLRAKSSYYMRGLVWSLLDYPDKQYEAQLTALIGRQLRGERHQRMLGDAFWALCKIDFWQAAQAVWSMLAEERRSQRAQYEPLMRDVLVAGHFDTFLGLMRLLQPEDRLHLLAGALRWDAEKRQSYPERVWTELLAGNVSGWRRESVGQVLCAALKARQMDVFRRVWQMVEGTFQRNDAVDAANVPILFHAIYDATAQHHYYFPGRPGVDESGEIIDSDDDSTSIAQKTAINAKRLCWVDEWRPSTLIVDPPLEAAYLHLFEDLIAEAADWRCLHPGTGETLLHAAVRRNNLAVAGRLLQLGLNPSAADNAGNVPMSLVRSAPMVALLPAADVRHIGADSQRPALNEYLTVTASHEQDVAVVAALLAAGADCNYRCPVDRKTPLLLSTSAEVAEVLLAAGADVNAADELGHSALWYACRDSDSRELMWLLLRQPSVDVWQRNAEGRVLLGQLMRRLTVAELREMVPELGGDHTELERLFVERAGGVLELCEVQRCMDGDDLRCLRTLLEQEDLRVSDGGQSFTYDSWRNQLECGAHISQRSDKRPLDWRLMTQPHSLRNEIEFFANAGFNVDFRSAGELRQTALQSYCTHFEDECEQMAVVARLIAAGADYRLRRQWDGEPLLLGMLLECLYEWDGERGLRVPEKERPEGEEDESDGSGGKD